VAGVPDDRRGRGLHPSEPTKTGSTAICHDGGHMTYRVSRHFGSPMLARDHPRWRKPLTPVLLCGGMMML
jgi:hypothetical protein